jgi:hypothetical protein
MMILCLLKRRTSGGASKHRNIGIRFPSQHRLSQAMSDLPEHKLKLSDEAWQENMGRAVMEEKPASERCAHVLRHYAALEGKLPVYIRSVPEGSLHSVFLEKDTWAELMRRRVIEKRPVSTILEQQLRAYLGLSWLHSGEDGQ